MLNWIFGSRRAAPVLSSQADLPSNQEWASQSDTVPLQTSSDDEYTQHVRFTTTCAVVTAWPSDGGILIKTADVVDLQHLGVSHSKPTPRPVPIDPAQEDIWAAKVRKIAPKWYRSIDDYYLADLGDRLPTPREKEKIFMGWPSNGGLWILRLSDGRTPTGFGSISVCMNMDERCKVLEKFGAQFYADPTECFELSQDYIEDCRRQRDADDLGWGE